MASTGVRSLIRQGQFFKLGSAVETGASDGSWSFARYGEWLSRKSDWHVPPPPQVNVAAREAPAPFGEAPALPPVGRPRVAPKRPAPRPAPTTRLGEDGVLELGEEDDPEAILRELEQER
jgi:twitching motility protein PilT